MAGPYFIDAKEMLVCRENLTKLSPIDFVIFEGWSTNLRLWTRLAIFELCISELIKCSVINFVSQVLTSSKWKWSPSPTPDAEYINLLFLPLSGRHASVQAILIGRMNILVPTPFHVVPPPSPPLTPNPTSDGCVKPGRIRARRTHVEFEVLDSVVE